tara:strand:- start:307 stop:465 length:159 start_codon:yes stop_codon:yes gene_type:complete
MYEGDWKNGKRSGYGSFRYTNGDIYNGLWLKNKKNGDGFMKYANGDVYNGNF